MRRYFADTFAQIVFSTIVGAFVEIFVARLSLGQSASVRLAAIPVILFVGRPYGLYRDWLFRLTAGNSSQLKATAVDTFANVTFQIPIYCALLAINGATVSQIVSAASSILVISALSGRPYGLFLVWCRKLFRVKAMTQGESRPVEPDRLQ
ncbi:L-alanine exporter AlaE [Mesorhizobium sp. 1M-11]|uniref:L-alanine exporter AlaE n=1 Tax=Mesorhizobium sp. 1M-11 TaxID=1529006 RepID=UPI00128EB4AE|nr:L-alanine exporter AlaE [Mesorhizobium sp. 1M-11]